MSRLTLQGAGTTRESRGPFDRPIVTHLHVYVHDFPNAVWLTCRRDGRNDVRDHADGFARAWRPASILLRFDLESASSHLESDSELRDDLIC